MSRRSKGLRGCEVSTGPPLLAEEWNAAQLKPKLAFAQTDCRPPIQLLFSIAHDESQLPYIFRITFSYLNLFVFTIRVTAETPRSSSASGGSLRHSPATFGPSLGPAALMEPFPFSQWPTRESSLALRNAIQSPGVPRRQGPGSVRPRRSPSLCLGFFEREAAASARRRSIFWEPLGRRRLGGRFRPLRCMRFLCRRLTDRVSVP